MPRPGPRPYECVRRAWHSDRHQPMRGSLIREIFRMANEAHSPATRKNQEWQEKLPFVVFKAEEILYSKANSEAEYTDLRTLWDRTNDAIDTIIRKDDTTETAAGDLLQPCIEAALILGCVPRRASRSQRYSNPGCYLSPTARHIPSAALRLPDNNKASSSAPPPPSPPLHPSGPGIRAPLYPTLLKPPADVNSTGHAAASAMDATCLPKSSCIAFNRASSSTFNYCSGPYNDAMPLPPCVGRVYPLYFYGKEEDASFQRPGPLGGRQEQEEKGTTELAQSILVHGGNQLVGSSSNFRETSALGIGCDLSLRLGMPSPSWMIAQSSCTDDVDDAGSSSSCNEIKFNEASPHSASTINLAN